MRNSTKQRKIASEHCKQLWKNPRFREKMKSVLSGNFLNRKWTDREREAQSIRMRLMMQKLWATKKHRNLISRKTKELWAGPKGRYLRKINRSAKRRDEVSVQITGSRNFFWRGGYKISYGVGWNRRLKRRIRIKFNNTCVLCSSAWSKGQQRFHVHHIDANKKNCKESNLTLLCVRCHARLHGWIQKIKSCSFWRAAFIDGRPGPDVLRLMEGKITSKQIKEIVASVLVVL